MNIQTTLFVVDVVLAFFGLAPLVALATGNVASEKQSLALRVGLWSLLLFTIVGFTIAGMRGEL